MKKNSRKIKPRNPEAELIKRKALENYYKKNYLKTIILLESLDWSDQSFKTLVVLGNSYKKSNTQSRMSIWYKRLARTSNKVEVDAWLMMSIIELATIDQSLINSNISYNYEISIEKSSETCLQEQIAQVFHSKDQIGMQYFFYQRLQMIKSIAKSSHERCELQIDYHKEGIAILMNEFSTLVPTGTRMAKSLKGNNMENIKNCFIVCAKNASNYYHFVAECLPCYYIADQILAKSVNFACQALVQDKLLKDRYHDFHVQMLTTFFPNRKIHRVDAETMILLTEAYTTHSLPSMVYAKNIISKMVKKHKHWARNGDL